MKIHSWYLFGALLLLLALSQCIKREPQQLNFYVSVQGDDKNPGTLSRPFATVETARDAIRNTTKRRQNICVFFRGGIYTLERPVQLGPQDSASDGYTISYAAYNDEKPVFSGGQRISGWQRREKNIWTTVLPAVRAGEWWFRELYRDGRRLRRGRFPNEGMLTISNVSSDAKQVGFTDTLPSFATDKTNVELVVLQNWSISRALVVMADQKSVQTATPCGWVGHEWTTAQPGKRAFLEHSLLFVDQPGEWYLDRSNGTLYYQAEANENPNDASFMAPKIEQLLVVNGRKGDPVRNLQFKGLEFAYASWQMPDVGYAGIQAGFYGPSYLTHPTYGLACAILLTDAENCFFDRCRLMHTAANGLAMGAGCRQNSIEGCEFDDVGGNGVMVGWRPKADLAPRNWFDSDWQDPSDTPTANRISNCFVHNCGAQFFDTVGIFDAFAQRTTIAHNLLSDLPYSGISIGFRWDTTATTQRQCTVANNHIHHVMKLLADGAGIYTLGWQPGTVLSGNLIHDIPRSEYTYGGAPNNGIFFDQGSKGFLIEKNVIHHTSGEPIRFNQCKKEWHTWIDNSFAISPGDKFPETSAGIEEPYRNICQ